MILIDFLAYVIFICSYNVPEKPTISVGQIARQIWKVDKMGKLTAIKIRKLKEPGKYGDGGGLFMRTGDTVKDIGLFAARLTEDVVILALAHSVLCHSPKPVK